MEKKKMAIEFLSISTISLLAIAIMILSLLIGAWRKIMLTYAIVIANFLVFLLTIFFHDTIIGELGFSSSYLSLSQFPQMYTILTSMFVHDGYLHILGNMLVFFFMGLAFEQRIGRKKFLLIYFLTGIIATLTQSLVNWGNPLLLVGASGAIFGILGAFAYSYPRDEVVMPVPIGIMFIMRIKVIFATIIFAAMETIIVYINSLSGLQDNTAHFAHLGGLVGGVLLAAVLIGKKAEKVKQSNSLGSTRYMQIQKSDVINFSHLAQFVKTPELNKIYQRIEKENVLQVRDMWLEHFLEKVTCPICNKPLNHFDRKIWCEQKHFQTDY
jgi:membrane associated rhomboid family serine protease